MSKKYEKTTKFRLLKTEKIDSLFNFLFKFSKNFNKIGNKQYYFTDLYSLKKH